MRSSRPHRLAPAIVAAAAAAMLASAAPAGAQTHRAALETPFPAALIGFGVAAAATGDELFVGRPGEFAVFPMPGAEAGSVHVFRRGAGGWAEVASVSASDGAVGDGFGTAIAAAGDLLVVGAPERAEGSGAAYVFAREDEGWVEIDRLAPEGLTAGDAFGAAVALDGETVLVGAPGRNGSGAVFAFRGQEPPVELAPVDAGADARFGAAIGLDGGTAVVGAPGPFGLSMVGGQPQFQAGSGYVFERGEDGAWSQAARLTSAGGALGLSVHLAGDEALLGAPIAAQGAGVVFRYLRDSDGAWSAAGQVAPATPPAQALFGYALAPAGDGVLVGAPGANGFNGAAYLFSRTADGWTEEQLLTAETLGLMGWMGAAVAGGADFAVVGAPGSEFFEGIGFVFTRTTSGEWVRETSIVESDAGLPPVTGGEMRCSEEGEVAGFACENVDLVSFLPVREVGGARGIMVSDVWGWTDPDTGREYAILGRFDGTSFVDVTDAENPVYLGNLPLTEGASPNLWRDMKVHADHAFIVADNAGQHGMQVFDLTRLRDVTDAPVEFAPDAVYDELASAHNIVINEATGFAYIVGGSGGGETCGGALHMVDLSDPTNPTFAGCYADPNTGQNGPGYTHDAQCVIYGGTDQDYQGREICFNASESALGIGDVTDKEAPTPISSATYPNVAYAHQGWLSEDQRHFYLNDELDELQGGTAGTRTMVWDVADLDDPVLVTEYVSENRASDHNLYVRGNFMYQSNYVSGLRIFDISDPENPRPVGHFDTVAGGEDVPGFAGSWSNYPFFESGNIIVSSMREGLFILKKRQPELVP